MNCLLISLQRDLDIIGLKLLHQYLLREGHPSHLLYLPELDFADGRALDALRDYVKGLAPGFVGMSLMAGEFAAAAALTQRLKAWFPDVPVIWGGIHPTTAPEMCVEIADYVCLGEGEGTLRDFAVAVATGRPVEDIRNLCFLKDGELRRNPLYPLIEDLDSLPWVKQIAPNSRVLTGRRVVEVEKRHLIRYKRYRGAVYKIITSRGCPYGCSYCCNHLLRRLYGTWRVRRRSPDHIIRELEDALTSGPHMAYVDFSDDCFLSCSVEYLRDFCAQYKARIGRPFIVKGTPHYFSREKLDIAVDAGLVWANMGLQTGSDRVCREVYDRPIRSDEFLETTRLLHEYPVASYYDVIVDNPYESVEDTLATVETIMEAPKPFYLLVFSLRFYHGTRLRERALVEHPDAVADPLTTDYVVRLARPVNTLVEIVGTFPGFLMRPLVKRFRAKPESLLTRAALRGARLCCRLFFEPVTYFRLIRRTQGGSLLGTLRVLPAYFNRGFTYYINSFDFSKRRP